MEIGIYLLLMALAALCIGGVISGGKIIEGALGAPHLNAGAPVNGTDEVQTLTIGGTPTGGTFTLTFNGFTTGAITWSATTATLLANINAALDALPHVAAGEILATEGSLSGGVGTVTLTFTGEWGKRVVSTITVTSSLTGTAPTLAVTEATPGVDATARGAAAGASLLDTTNKKEYINTGTQLAPTWTVKGSQS
jgi:hypothetical protein